jgi:CelD/BcsL family acetyltransferase involved in cellulose biosynthesis
VYRDCVYAYQTGFAYADDARLKPGLVSHYLCLQHHLQKGAKVYDFMAGDNRYKSNLGMRGPDMMHHVLQRKTVKSQGEAFLRSLKRRLA